MLARSFSNTEGKFGIESARQAQIRFDARERVAERKNTQPLGIPPKFLVAPAGFRMGNARTPELSLKQAFDFAGVRHHTLNYITNRSSPRPRRAGSQRHQTQGRGKSSCPLFRDEIASPRPKGGARNDKGLEVVHPAPFPLI